MARSVWTAHLPYAMNNLLKHKDDFDVAIGNDPDYDRHGIVTARRFDESKSLFSSSH